MSLLLLVQLYANFTPITQWRDKTACFHFGKLVFPPIHSVSVTFYFFPHICSSKPKSLRCVISLFIDFFPSRLVSVTVCVLYSALTLNKVQLIHHDLTRERERMKNFVCPPFNSMAFFNATSKKTAHFLSLKSILILPSDFIDFADALLNVMTFNLKYWQGFLIFTFEAGIW